MYFYFRCDSTYHELIGRVIPEAIRADKQMCQVSHISACWGQESTLHSVSQGIGPRKDAKLAPNLVGTR